MAERLSDYFIRYALIRITSDYAVGRSRQDTTADSHSHNYDNDNFRIIHAEAFMILLGY